MTPEDLQKIINTAIENEFENYWLYWFIIIGTSIIVSIIATLITSYLKEKGKNLATKEDIEEITKKIESIKHDYNRQLEEFKQEQLIRYKAEIVAELIAEWLDKPEDIKRLNKLSFEAFIWLPDDICNELSKLLSHKSDAKPYRDVLIDTRKYLLKETTLKAWEIINFPKKIKQKDKKMEIHIPKFTGDNIPNYIEFDSKEKIEVFVEKISMGVDLIENYNVSSLNDFIIKYLNQIALANNFDHSKIISEINKLNKTGNNITYYDYELKEIFDLIN